MSGLVAVCAVAGLTAGQTPTPGPETPTFKVQVDYVEVDAFVTDKDGHFIRDLKKDEFQVFEDGKPQTINAFTLVDIPIERAVRPLFAAQPVEPDVRTNARPFDGRVYVLLLDDLHIQASHTPRVRASARRFIEENLGANDLMAVIHTFGRTEDSQEFTSNKRLLLNAVDKFLGKAEESATAARYQQYAATSGIRRPGQEVLDPVENKRGYDAKMTLDELEGVSNWFGSVRGRKKTILFISEGIDYDIYDIFNKHDATMISQRTQDLIRAATKSNVTIYPIDPRGLTDMGDQTIELNGLAAGDAGDPALADLNARGFAKELRLQQDSLRTFAENTGGFAVVNRNDFANAFARIVEENSSYYVLAYYPPNPKRDGKFHNIRVRVTRPGLTVRARSGYAAPTAKAAAAAAPKPGVLISAEAREALQSPLPVSGVTLQVFAAPFKGTAPNASVLLGVEMRGRDLRLGTGDKLQVSYVAVDAKGKIKAGNTDQFILNLRPETKKVVEETGVRTLSRVQLPPGRYQLRVAANDVGPMSVGTVLYDLEVPDFTKTPLSMSGLVLTSIDASREPTIRHDEEMKQVMPGPPAGNRVFPPNDELGLFVEVYDNTAASHKVDITTTVTSDEGKVVFKTDDVRDSAELEGKRGGYGYTTRVPLKELPTGIYVLKVEAKSRLGQNAGADRQVQFRIAEMTPAQTQ